MNLNSSLLNALLNRAKKSRLSFRSGKNRWLSMRKENGPWIVAKGHQVLEKACKEQQQEVKINVERGEKYNKGRCFYFEILFMNIIDAQTRPSLLWF